MRDAIETPLPPAALSHAVATWYGEPHEHGPSLIFHLWEHLLAAGVLTIEPDEDDQNVTHIIYRLDVTPEVHADPVAVRAEPRPPKDLPATCPPGFAVPEKHTRDAKPPRRRPRA